MSRQKNPPLPFPPNPFGLLLVEGGDEESLCKAVAGPKLWSELRCWKAQGRDDLKPAAQAANRAANFKYARSVGIVLDAEEDPHAALNLAKEALAELGNNQPLAHGTVTSQPHRFGVFLLPDGQSLGSIESLCRFAVRDSKRAACVDALVACAQTPHSTKALAAKGWLQAYFAMFPEPHRFHEAFDLGKGSIDPAHSAFDPLRIFLSNL